MKLATKFKDFPAWTAIFKALHFFGNSRTFKVHANPGRMSEMCQCKLSWFWLSAIEEYSLFNIVVYHNYLNYHYYFIVNNKY